MLIKLKIKIKREVLEAKRATVEKLGGCLSASMIDSIAKRWVTSAREVYQQTAESPQRQDKEIYKEKYFEIRRKARGELEHRVWARSARNSLASPEKLHYFELRFNLPRRRRVLFH